MAENSGIEWTDHTWNPWIGCTKVGPGCKFCYAEVLMDHRHHRVEWGGARSRTGLTTWGLPMKWQRAAPAFLQKHGRRQRVFCSSLADVFDNQVDPAWRRDVARIIADTPDLDWLLLTKRIGNVPAMLLDMCQAVGLDDLPNVRIGATIVNQEEWDRDAGKVAQVAVIVGRNRVFLSMEPLLGAVDLHHAHYPAARTVGWVIVGGESGKGDVRPLHPHWVRMLRLYCAANGIPFLFKQWGEWAPVELVADINEDQRMRCYMGGKGGSRVHVFDDHQQMGRIGKKAAGRILDGSTYTEFPR